MGIPLAEAFKREAIPAVLTRLGEPMYVLMKLKFAQDHKIYIDKNDTYTLEDLHMALQEIVGPDGAGLLMREIGREIELLTDNQTH